MTAAAPTESERVNPRVYCYAEELAQLQAGPRFPEPSHALIFEQTWSGSMTQKATSLGLGALFWAVWVSLWVPLLTVAFWALLPSWGAGTVVASKQDSFPAILLVVALGLALASLLILVGTWEWATSGLTHSPSSGRENVSLHELAASDGLGAHTVEAAWRHRRLVVHHDADGAVSDIEMSKPLP